MRASGVTAQLTCARCGAAGKWRTIPTVGTASCCGSSKPRITASRCGTTRNACLLSRRIFLEGEPQACERLVDRLQSFLGDAVAAQPVHEALGSVVVGFEQSRPRGFRAHEGGGRS